MPRVADRFFMTIPGAALPAGLREKEPLKPHTTFKIGGPARYFARVRSPQEVREAIVFAQGRSAPVFVLGGGSNLLVSDRGFDGLVLHPACEGAGEPQRDSNTGFVRFRINAGEAWDRAVACAVDHGWWGIENLSHIPGQSGAALVQNIGAYGQQLSDVLESAEVLELSTGEAHLLQANECGLGYRRSIFNGSHRGEFIILSITLRLPIEPRPNLGYRDLRAYFEERSIDRPSQLEIRRAIISIRDRKFPYPREARGGNAGSSFKNPTLSAAEFQALERSVRLRFGAAEVSRLDELSHRPGSTDSVKVPAALLIDMCGLKGFGIGGAQVNPPQPLVILNLGTATAEDVLCLAGHVRRTVYRETGVKLELEPELVGFAPGETEGWLGPVQGVE